MPQSKAFQLRRAELGLGEQTPGMLICDGFTGNFSCSSGEDARRAQWASENRVLLPQRPPGPLLLYLSKFWSNILKFPSTRALPSHARQLKIYRRYSDRSFWKVWFSFYSVFPWYFDETLSGGWSACGQPCDAYHSLFRKLAHAYMDTYLGYNADPLEQASSSIKIGVNGTKHLSTTPETTVKSLIYAWQCMQSYKRTLRWAWVTWICHWYMFYFQIKT